MTRSLMLALTVFAALQGRPAPTQDDAAALVRAHETMLAAHRNGDPASWMALEADRIVVGRRGTVTFSTKAERGPAREAYLKAARFTSYRDLRPPIVRVSADGTMGWLIAQVEVKGSRRLPDGSREPIDTVWAWVELYEKVDGRWRGVGNVSSERPAPSLAAP